MLDCLLVVVSYRSAEDVSGLLATVPGAAAHLSWRVVVVNNDPADDLAPVVEAAPQVEVVESGSNLGYAGGINVALMRAPASRWTVFLNPDLRLGPGALATLAEAAGPGDAAVPRIVDEGGSVQTSLRREPALLGSLGDALFGARWRTRPAWLSETMLRPSTYDRPITTDWATGAAIVVPSALVHEVGPWDSERFFLYSEETDYCRRLRARGAHIRYVPDAVVSHRGGGSGTSDALYALLEVNRVRYFRKWHGPLPSALFTLIALLKNLLRAHRARSRVALVALLSASARSALPGGTRQAALSP